MNALIVDSDSHFREHLRHLLELQSVSVLDEVDCPCRILDDTVRLQPDILFLNTQMPELSWLEVVMALQKLVPSPFIVFVTRDGEHAVPAFEHDALDYLLKPVTPERLASTVGRAIKRQRAIKQGKKESSESDTIPAAPTQASLLLRRLPVRADYAIRFLSFEKIRYVGMRNRKSYVRMLDGSEHRALHTLTQLEMLLPSDTFLRVHDSFLVNLNAVEELLFLGNHSRELEVGSDQRLPVGKTHYNTLVRSLGLQPSARA